MNLKMIDIIYRKNFFEISQIGQYCYIMYKCIFQWYPSPWFHASLMSTWTWWIFFYLFVIVSLRIFSWNWLLCNGFSVYIVGKLSMQSILVSVCVTRCGVYVPVACNCVVFCTVGSLHRSPSLASVFGVHSKLNSNNLGEKHTYRATW